jgi:predicted amino acid-binding ACT domain protein
VRGRTPEGTLGAMLEEIVVVTDDQPGVLADIGELLGRAGVNIETLSAMAHD